ncbi:CsbD family protein [Companilactobacillus allii]|uniref:CsbD family protein n=1 Tax=Companilactobacillus allii TaxID=1847728 RepID=A0A1P8Q5N7_9LACO|nr:CsbD family protein [Companilactobacillus allii]APX73160.1 CsbD family protein [Companilactobacillus allii]USQ67967.1 CsbD family protein [Companilactobacillus allii]
MSIDSKEDMIKGKTNQAVGKVTNDDKKELKGKIQEKVAQAKEKGEDVIDKVAKKVNKKNDSK